MQQAQVLLTKMSSVDRDHLCKDDLREETQTGPREIQTSFRQGQTSKGYEC